MNNYFRNGSLLVAVMLLAACAGASKRNEERVAFSPAAAQAIASTRVVIGVDDSLERNQAPAYHSVTGGQFGLLGAVIETAMAASFESERQQKSKAVAEVRGAAIKFNFSGVFKAELEKALRGMPWLNVSYVYSDAGPQIHNVERVLSEVTEDALMVADVAYVLAPDLAKMVVTAYVDVYPKKPGLTQLARVSDGVPVLYRGNFKLEYPLDEYTDATQAASSWARNEGEMVHRVLRQAVSDLVAKITLDLGTRVPSI